MEITWLGRACFRLKGREGTVLTDPPPADSGYSIGAQSVDMVTLSRRDDPGYSNTAAAKDVRVLDAPGEYEIGGVLVTGIATKRSDGSRNVAFICELDGIRVAHLGLMTDAPTGAALEALQNVDVILMPVGGGNAIGARMAADLMTTLDPKIVIPMNYKTEQERMADLEPIDKFIAEAGLKLEPEAKLTVSMSSLPEVLSVRLLSPASK